MDIHFSADPSAFAPVLSVCKISLGLAIIAAVDIAVERYWPRRKG
jgi:hypothetical protein